MKHKIATTILTFFLVADSFFLEYYFTVRIALLLFALFLIISTKQPFENKLIKRLGQYYLYIWFGCIIHLVLVTIINPSPFFIIQIPRAISMLFQTIIVYFLSYALFCRYGSKASNILCISFIGAYVVCIAKGAFLLGPIGLIEYAFDFSDDKIRSDHLSL